DNTGCVPTNEDDPSSGGSSLDRGWAGGEVSAGSARPEVRAADGDVLPSGDCGAEPATTGGAKALRAVSPLSTAAAVDSESAWCCAAGGGKVVSRAKHVR